MSMFSVTEIESYKRCRRKWHLSSLNHTAYTPIWPAMNTLGLGSLTHRAGEAWLHNPSANFGDIFFECGKAMFKELMTVCDKTGYRHTDQQETDFWAAITLGRHMCTNYQNYWHTPLPNDYILVKPEQQMVVPIPGTEHEVCTKLNSGGYCECPGDCCGIEYPSCHTTTPNHLGVEHCRLCSETQCHYLEGTLDAIIGDQSGRLFVYERKTFGQHPTIHHLNRVWQFVAYSWILRQAVLHWGTQNEVAGLLYDGLWKRSTPPSSGKWKDNWDSLFLRHYILHNDDTLDEFERELVPTVLEMANPNTYITHTIPAVRGCIDCDLTEVCDRMTKGEDTQLLLRTQFTKRDLTPAYKEFYTSEVE